MGRLFLGVDVGSVSTNFFLMGENKERLFSSYLRTKGQPIASIKKGLKQLGEYLPEERIAGVGVTGSGRSLAAALLGADVVKNEITAHGVAACNACPGVHTVLEIGGQDSKLILLRRGVVVDFAMNSVCAAGTGSFLDQQAARLGIPIAEFGQLALAAKTPVRIAGRCSVFAESDMVHKQQLGNTLPDIIAGLCAALVRNYLNNLGKGKELKGPVVFQGGVAANPGIKKAFEQALGMEIMVPEHYGVMGAWGAALLAQASAKGQPSAFLGVGSWRLNHYSRSFYCQDCANNCEVIELRCGERVQACWGDRCGKWTGRLAETPPQASS